MEGDVMRKDYRHLGNCIDLENNVKVMDTRTKIMVSIRLWNMLMMTKAEIKDILVIDFSLGNNDKVMPTRNKKMVSIRLLKMMVIMED